MSARLLQPVVTVGSVTLLSRFMGLLRDVVIAQVFGSTAATDAFVVAFRIPNLLRRLFAEGAFSQSFVPVLAQHKALGGSLNVRDLIGRTAGTLGVVVAAATVIGILLAPVLIGLFAPGFVGEAGQLELATQMLRITFPYLLCIALAALAASVLNTHGYFAAPAFTPVLLNVSMIASALWLAPRLDPPILALAWGVVLGGVLQLGFQLPPLRKLGLLPRPRVAFRDPGVRSIQRLMLPAIFGVSVTQINLLIDTLLASFLVSGSISWLYYSERLVEFPLGVFGVALSTAILPHLSLRHAEDSREEFSRSLDWALRWVTLISVPAALGLLLVAGAVLTTVFHYGEFGAGDVGMASRSLRAYAVGVPAFILVKVLAPAFYARQDTRTPVRTAVLSMLANIVFSLLLIYPLAHAGLALATSIAAWINAAVLLLFLRRDGIYEPGPGWPGLGWRVGLAAAALVLVVFPGTMDLAGWASVSGLERVLRLLSLVVLGAGAYVLCLWLLRLPFASLLRH